MASRYVPLGPFTYTATGDLGEQRDPMLCNELHLRDRVGHAKVRGFYLPGKGFTYGRPNEKRDYTAVDAMRGWTGCFKLHEDKPKKPLGRDFMALNRAAVSTGLVTAKEQFDYRTTHDYRVKPPPELISRGTRKFPSSMVFGLPARPQTPMFDLLEHRYQDKWIRQMHAHTQAERKKTTEKKHHMMNYDTRASMLRTYQNPVDPKPLWQMPRFANWAQPHLQTFRSSRTKEESWKSFDLDSVSRKGPLKQGVYEGAKN